MKHTLAELVNSGELVIWRPTLDSDPIERILLLTKKVDQELDSDLWLDPETGRRFAQLSADFDRFATGDTIPVALAPYDKDDNAFMARIDPIELGVWSIRSVAPKPALRVLGCFCEPDVFLAIDTYERKHLGGPGDRRWANARENALAKWRHLLPDHSPLTGSTIIEYITQKTVPA